MDRYIFAFPTRSPSNVSTHISPLLVLSSFQIICWCGNSNDIYNVDAEEEYIDFHFKLRHQGYDLEFIYDNWEDVYFLQSESKEALKLFDASANFFEIENSKIKWLYPKE